MKLTPRKKLSMVMSALLEVNPQCAAAVCAAFPQFVFLFHFYKSVNVLDPLFAK